jgi:hypothetical protein
MSVTVTTASDVTVADMTSDVTVTDDVTVTATEIAASVVANPTSSAPLAVSASAPLSTAPAAGIAVAASWPALLSMASAVGTVTGTYPDWPQAEHIRSYQKDPGRTPAERSAPAAAKRGVESGEIALRAAAAAAAAAAATETGEVNTGSCAASSVAVSAGMTPPYRTAASGGRGVTDPRGPDEYNWSDGTVGPVNSNTSGESSSAPAADAGPGQEPAAAEAVAAPACVSVAGAVRSAAVTATGMPKERKNGFDM